MLKKSQNCPIWSQSTTPVKTSTRQHRHDETDCKVTTFATLSQHLDYYFYWHWIIHQPPLTLSLALVCERAE